MGGIPWSQEEMSFLVVKALDMNVDELSKCTALTGRSKISIKRKAKRLGLRIKPKKSGPIPGVTAYRKKPGPAPGSAGLSGADNPLWKGGRRKNQMGYILKRCVGHPRASKLGSYVLEHRLAMENRLGRYLTDDEVVHHKNDIRDDNRIENLVLMTSSEHATHHNLVRRTK